MSAEKTPFYSKDEKITIARAYRLSTLKNCEGWPDLVNILDSIVNEAHERLYQYKGSSDVETAELAKQWKVARAVKEKFMAELNLRIKEGADIVTVKVPPVPNASAGSFPAVRPQCDVDAEAQGEAVNDAPAPPPNLSE